MINGLESNVHIQAKIIPSAEDCRICMEIADCYDAMPDCDACYKEKDVKILQFVKNFWGSYAIVADDKGAIKEIPVYRLKTNVHLSSDTKEAR